MENIRLEKRDGAAWVTVDRPKALNALNRATIAEMSQAFDELRADRSIGVIVVTGGGEKAFIAGADISELAEESPASARENSLRGQAMCRAIEECGKPVIAAINGFALGGGLEVALACHIRIASENARLGLPEVGLGIIPGYGGTQRLPRIVGSGVAIEMIATGRHLSAADALRVGLVNRVVPLAELRAAAESIAAEIVKNGPLAVRAALGVSLAGLEGTLREGTAREAEAFGRIYETADLREGLAAFLEKRKPKFVGE
ncbi:MAG: enoyl-CoA hydratase/isomerase family protein [bacterium]